MSTLVRWDPFREVAQLQNELDQAAAQGAISSSYKNVKPVLKCVEKVNSSTYKAHWGYKSTNDTKNVLQRNLDAGIRIVSLC